MRLKRFIPLLLLVHLFIFIPLNRSNAQIVVESFITDDNLTIENWWVKSIDTSHRVNLFNLNEFIFDYDDESIFSHYNLLQLSYDLYKGLGPLIGMRVTNFYYRPHAGIQYTAFGKNIFLNTQITTEFTEFSLIEWFTILSGSFELKGKVDLFTQLQSSFSFRNGDNEYSFQKFRIGPEWEKFQCGLGINLIENGPDFEMDVELGLFLRLSLN